MSGCAGGRLLCTACARSSPRLHLHLAARQGARYTRHRPAEDLAELTFLGLTRNELSGPIPPELGDLANLEELRLDENRLEGELPPELGNLIKLEQLHLDDNQLSGEIPAELIELPDLALLYLSGNELSGWHSGCAARHRGQRPEQARPGGVPVGACRRDPAAIAAGPAPVSTAPKRWKASGARQGGGVARRRPAVHRL